MMRPLRFLCVKNTSPGNATSETRLQDFYDYILATRPSVIEVRILKLVEQ